MNGNFILCLMLCYTYNIYGPKVITMRPLCLKELLSTAKKLLFCLLLGGWRQSVDNTNTVECYNPKTKVWQLVGSLNCRRFRPGTAVVDGKIFVCGGEEGCDR